MFVIGTAGHVDHGKSTLVESLTGIDPDRFQEEKDRGMTIDIGFAWVNLPSGRKVSIVDVPGHEKFVSNMLAGVGGVDMALLVVAADESVMPQTKEHLAILDLLGISNCVVVVTKKDLVDEDWLQLVYAEIRDILDMTTLKDSEIISVSAATKDGLVGLMESIDTALNKVKLKKDLNRPRLPIDRSFSISGFGTVVTGTLIDGSLSVGQEIEIIPRGLPARIRGLQSHGKSEIEFGPGTRVAANLSGIEATQISRGDVLSLPNSINVSEAFDVRLHVVEDSPNPLRHNMFVNLHTGSSEVISRLRLLEGEEVQPGQSTWAQMKPDKPLPVLRGDHFIVRSNMTTLGGGNIVDINAKRHRRRHSPTLKRLESLEYGTPSEILVSFVDSNPSCSFELVRSLSSSDEGELISIIETLIEEKSLIATSKNLKRAYFFSKNSWGRLVAAARKTLEFFHEQFPLRQGISREELRNKLNLSQESFNSVIRMLEETKSLTESNSLISIYDYKPEFSEEQSQVAERFVSDIAGGRFSPRTDIQIDDDILNFLLEKGRLVKVAEGVVFSREIFDEMLVGLRNYISHNDEITVGDFRDLYQTSRKYALAVLDYLDQQQITRRVGDARVLRD